MDSFGAMSKPWSGLPLPRVRCRNSASTAFWTVCEQSAGHYSATRYLPKPGISGRPFWKTSKPGSAVPVEKTWLDFSAASLVVRSRGNPSRATARPRGRSRFAPGGGACGFASGRRQMPACSRRTECLHAPLPQPAQLALRSVLGARAHRRCMMPFFEPRNHAERFDRRGQAH